MNRRTYFAALVALLAPTAAFAQRPITIKGSDTMVILVQRWAEEFMKKNDVTLQVTGGGSGVGISAIIGGSTDICMASREMKPSEKTKLRNAAHTTGVEMPVAKDGLAIYVHSSNPLTEITMDQIRDIFLGKVTNWKDLGGPDNRIIVYSRENSSGTYVYFKDVVLKGRDFTPRAQTMPGTASVVNAVSKEKFGIGYGGAAYAKGIKVLKVKKDAGAPAIAPSHTTVADGSYVLTRPLFFYLRNQPSGDVKKFTDWVLSPEGQALTLKVGYYPLK